MMVKTYFGRGPAPRTQPAKVLRLEAEIEARLGGLV